MFKLMHGTKDKQQLYERIANTSNKELVVSRILQSLILALAFVVVARLFEEFVMVNPFVIIIIAFIIGIPIDLFERSYARKKLEKPPYDSSQK